MHRLPVNIFKIRRFLKNLCVWYLIFFFSFGQVGMVFAQEATQSALLQDVSIPKLRLPFDGMYARGLGFADNYTNQKIIDSLGDIAQQGHDGIDFALPEGTPVYAVDDGEVVIAGESDFGITVKIDHAWGSSVYGHLKETKVTVGQKVSVSNHDVIGLSGATGVTEGPHLHFGIKPKQLNGEKEILGFIDPASYMDIASLPVYNPTASVSAQLLSGNIATASAIASQSATIVSASASASQDVLGATLPRVENIATDSAYLFNYKFDLDKGTTAHFYDKETKRPSFAVANESYDYKLRFFLENQGESYSEPTVIGNKVEFPVVVKGIPMTLRYTIDQNRVKEEFIIKEKPSDEIFQTLGENLQIPFVVSTVGLEIQYKNGEYIFISTDGKIVWRILAPTVEDSLGKKGTPQQVALAVDDTKAVLGVNTSFLKEASYPVIIDPTWTQSTWDGGSGTSTTNQFSSSSSVTTSTAGQFTLTNSEKLTNTTFETNTTSWNTGAQPDSISGLNLWLKADAITGLTDGNKVSSWVDSSGNSNHAIQGTDANRPTYKTNIINSLPVVRFPGGSTVNLATTNTITQSQPYTMFAVAKRSGDFTTYSRLIWTSGSRGEIGFNNAANQFFAYAGNAGYPAVTASDSTWHIMDAVLNTTASTLAVDGSVLITTGNVGTGNMSSSTVYIGGGTTLYTLNGDFAEAIFYGGALSSANRIRIENYLRDKYAITVSSGITSATRSTTQAHGGSASAKLVTSSADTGEFTQTVNVGDTNTYNLSAYAYTTGAAVTSSDVELFYNGSTVSTTYTSAGGGWYQLTGTVTGANASRIYGVQVKANKTVYVDDISLNGYASSGSLTSAIFDSAQRSDWGTLTYNATVPSNSTVSIKARTSNSSDMTGATAFSSCSAITSGADISSNSCVTDTHRYIQYEVSLTSTDTTTATATFQDVSIVYSLSLPDAPSSLSGSPSTSSIIWSWTDNSSDEDGFYVQDTSGNTKCTVSSANTTTCTESSLSPNTSYTRKVVAYNSAGNSSASSNALAVTYSTAPTTSNITSNRSTSTWYNTASFTFTNGIGFGAGGVEYLRYVWDTSSSHTWTGSETQWTSGTLTQTATSDGNSWYLHLKGYNSNNTENGTLDFGPFYYDATAPVSFDLDSPGADSYISSERPTYKWKTTTDATAGLSSYSLEIDNGDSGDFSITGIPTSRTTDYDTSKYLIHYDGSYISIYTKSSSSWGTGENDGKLKEGKRTWKIVAVDNAGNTKESSRTIYADYNIPTLSDVSIENAGQKDGYTIVTAQKPGITATATDTVGLDYARISFHKKTFFLGISTGEELSLSGEKTLSGTSQTFTYTPSQNLDYGKYRVVISVFDKAGNKSNEQEMQAQLLTQAKANELLGPKEETEVSMPSISDLEKQALLRREKEAAQLQQFITALNQEMGIVGDFLASIYTQTTEYIAFVWGNTVTFLAQGITESTEIAMDISDTLKSGSQSFITTLNRSIDSSQEVLVRQIRKEYVGVTDSITDNGNNAIASIVGGIENTRNAAIDTSYSLVVAANQQVEESIISVATAMKATGESIQESGQSLLGAVGEGIKLSDSGLQSVNTALSQSQEQTQKQIALLHQTTSQNLQKAGEAAGVAWRSLIKPAVETKNFADRVVKGTAIAFSTFQAYVFDQNPTKIAKVTIEELGSDYVVVSWETNHLTNSNVVNYGDSLSYGNKAWAPDGETYHKVKLTKLEPGKRYFFEVMSQNKNYAYDAYYSFETIRY